ncbi:MAG: anaerobic ribonucleoside-triphosphate reductase [Lactobacillaceae bacterium]|jgi:hypothetical protein|nr:anaerobic ribonucleoside-triphosphate reductase [Lactobacillaceae bacterium]
MTVINMENIKLKDEERQPCEIWTRVMGYHRPVSEFNKGKKSEYYSRTCFCEGKALGRMSSDDALSVAAE